MSLAPRKCIDCGHRWTPTDVGPWIDPMVCPDCGGDETIGEVSVTLEQELAQIAGDLRFDTALGQGRR